MNYIKVNLIVFLMIFTQWDFFHFDFNLCQTSDVQLLLKKIYYLNQNSKCISVCFLLKHEEIGD